MDELPPQTQLAQVPSPGQDVPSRSRMFRACENCRSLKARCLPSAQPDSCQKCLKLRKPCISTEYRPRPRRAAGQKRGVAEMGEKLDKLFALIAEPGTANDGAPLPSRHSSRDSEQEPVAVAASVEDRRAQAIQPSPNLIAPPQTTPVTDESALPDCATSTRSYPLGVPPLRNISPEAHREFAYAGILDVADADSLLLSFQDLWHHFPFVSIPQGSSARTLSRDRPFLLLGVLASVSSPNRQLQTALDEELKKTLGIRTITRGEKSLDLLQGLLVYLAWYHFHFRPQTQQIYQLLQIAIGMVIDLGLHREPSRLISRTGGIDLPHGKGKEDHASTPKGRFWSREERRALLGCYYLSSTTSMSFNKPNNMRYSEYMISTAQSLADEEELTTDVALPSLIQLQHIAEEVSEMLRADDPAKVFAVSGDLRLRIYMKQFELQLQKCRQASLATKTTFPILELAHHFVNIYLFEIGLYLEPPPLEERVNEGYHSSSPSEPATNPSAAPTPRSTLSAAPPNTSTRTPNDPSFAATRLDILLHCFEATKAYLDHFLTLPLTHFRRYTVIDWIRLTYAIIVLSKLSRPIPSLPHWNVQSVRDAAKLELYLESLCYRMQSITTCISATTPDGAPSEPDVFLAFKISFERMRNWFQARMAQPGGRSLGGSTTSNPPGPSGDEGSPLEVLREVHGGTEGGFGKTPPALRNSDDHHNARWPQEVNEGHANPLADPSSAADGTATDFGGVGAGGFTGLLAPDDDFWRALTDWTHLPEFGEMEF